jgi:uncharacterized delta-60 repeat protein
MTRKRPGGVWIFFLLFILPGNLAAAQGDLDLSFNPPNGFAVFKGPGDRRDRGIEVAIQTDGKILVLGYSHNGTNDDLLLVRYTPDGELDPTFNQVGFVTYNGGQGDDRGLGLALQVDGKIIAVGQHHNGADRDMLVLRYLNNGTLDPAFANQGVFIYPGTDSGTNLAFGAAIQKDGKILVTGESSNGSNQDLILLRLTPAGVLDGTFGSSGVVTFPGPVGGLDRGFAVVVQNDEKIVVVGAATIQTKDDLLALRYHPNGTPDTGFATQGVFLFSGAGDRSDYGYGVSVQPDGKIVVTGVSTESVDTSRLLVLRLTGQGTLDQAFGTQGVVTYPSSGTAQAYGYGAAFQGDGKILAVGSVVGGSGEDVLVLRLNTNGTLDETFGVNGVVLFQGAGKGIDRGHGLALQKDGKIVVTGFSFDGTTDDLLVLRLWGPPWAHYLPLFTKPGFQSEPKVGYDLDIF